MEPYATLLLVYRRSVVPGLSRPEWGTPQRDPALLFEMLLLEGFQAGLSWITVLKKRERYREVLHGFDPVKLSQMSDERIEELMLDAGIIRNRLKLKAARRNAQAWLAVDNPAEWLWSFVGGAPGSTTSRRAARCQRLPTRPGP